MTSHITESMIIPPLQQCNTNITTKDYIMEQGEGGQGEGGGRREKEEKEEGKRTHTTGHKQQDTNNRTA